MLNSHLLIFKNLLFAILIGRHRTGPKRIVILSGCDIQIPILSSSEDFSTSPKLREHVRNIGINHYPRKISNR
ncbi:hypothetical protein X962_5636 [Burkholderia pseudomallei MSHR7343]|nr:hypothetical protein X962_5636 [Burkholderia pseudomallei MSHR7343]